MTEHDNQHSANSGELVKLLSEVRQCFTRDDDLPGDLLSRIDAAIDGVMASDAPNVDQLKRMAYRLRLVPEGADVAVQLLDVLREQFLAAMAAAGVAVPHQPQQEKP